MCFITQQDSQLCKLKFNYKSIRMKENLVCCFILIFCSGLVTTGAGNQYHPDCCHRIAVRNKGPGEDGHYRFKQITTGLPEFCVGGCVYHKEDGAEPDQEFCFYQAQLQDEVSECLVDVLTTTSKASPLSTTQTGSPATTTASTENDISMPSLTKYYTICSYIVYCES